MLLSDFIKVLVVEDSPSVAELLIYIIQSDPLLKVMGCVNSRSRALDFIKADCPDVVIIDMATPHLNGFETTRQIMQNHPLPIIIFCSDFKKDDVNQSFQALNAGALEILAKPTGLQDPYFAEIATALIQLIKAVAGMKLIKRFYMTPVPKFSDLSPQEIKNSSVIEAIAIGASLGGPQALSKIFAPFSSDFPVPIFVVQHMTTGFIQGFVDWLQSTTRLKVKLAKNHEIPNAGTIYVAPDHYHLEITKNHQIKLSTAPAEQGLRPSISHLFRSMVSTYGSHAVGVILTGMGHDGVEELWRMKEAGAWTIAQDQESSLMFGMPKRAITRQAVKQILSLDELAYHLQLLVKKI